MQLKIYLRIAALTGIFIFIAIFADLICLVDFTYAANFSHKTFDKAIIYSSKKYDIPIAFLVAVMRAESGFDVNALSPKGAVGLMQIMPKTGRQLKLNPYNPLTNIIAGAKYLHYCLERFNGNPVASLACYNAGPNSVKVVKYADGSVKYYSPDYRQTRLYILRVYRYYKYYSKLLK